MRKSSLRSVVIVNLVAGLLALAGCGTSPTKGGGARPSAPATSGPVTPTGPLAGEARWMQSLFDGTPVQVEPERDGAVRVELPMSYAFDGESATPKPPLKAVLDKLALSLYRQPTARVHLGPPGPAARERLAALRGYLGNKGVAAPRMLATAPAQTDRLLLRLTPPPVGIERLDDDSLPAQPVMPLAPTANSGQRASLKPPSSESAVKPPSATAR